MRYGSKVDRNQTEIVAEAFASVAERLSRDYDRRAAGGGGFRTHRRRL